MDTVIEFLNTLASRGIKLSVEEGRLNCYAQKGMLTDEIRGGIVRYKPEIIALLDRVAASHAGGGPAAVAVEFPLSAGQKGLYIVQSLQPEMSAYNVPLCFRIRGQLDATLLARAWQRVLDQFPILAARMVETGDGLRHHIDEACRTALETTAVRFADDADRIAFLRARAKVPFDLNRGPLSRAQLFVSGPDESILLITVHHIIFDGTSSVVLLKHLLTFYRQLCLGEVPSLSREPLGYAEFVAWEEQMLDSAEGRSHANYWRRQLDGELPVIELLPPEPHQRAGGGFEGDTLIGDLPAALGRWVHDHCRSRALPPSVLFLAAFQLMLRRYTGLDDIIVGMPVMGRDGERFSADVGYFINMVPLRTHCDGTLPIEDHFRRVQGTMLDALYHSSYPFPRMLEALRSKQQDQKNPVFQVSYAYQNFIRDDGFSALLQRQGIRVEGVPGIVQEGDFDFGLEVFENEDTFTLHLKYNPGLYPRDAIARFFAQYRFLLETIALDTRRTIDALPAFDAEEARRLLVDFNATAVDYRRDACLHTLFEEQAAAHPERIALVQGETSLGYGELLARSHDLALYLQSQGVGPGALVGLCLDRSIDMMVALLAILRAGAAYLPLDPSYPDDRLAFMIEDSGTTMVLTRRNLQDGLRALAPERTRLLALDAEAETIASRVAALARDGVALRRDVRPQDLAYVIYTSGSTGKPKGVMVEHGGVVNMIGSLQRSYGLTADDRILQFAAMSFDMSVEEYFCALCTGAVLVLRTDEWLEGGARFWALCRAAKLTVMNLPTTFWHQLVIDGCADIPRHVRQISIGGEGVGAQFVEAWFRGEGHRPVLWDAYGPTESSVNASLHRVDSAGGRPGLIGRPIDNTQIYILDAQGRPQPIGVPGELHIGGEGLARGYLNRPELTAEKFVENPFVPGTRMYRTGDLARWLDDGNVQYLGRIDNQVKIRGFRIETGEIEARLLDHPGIDEAVVIAQDQGASKQLVAYYRAADATVESPVELPVETLKAHLQETLPEYMVPAAFVALGEIPLTPNGKVDRQALSRMDVTIASGRAYVAPRTATERSVVSIWSQVLGVPEDGIGAEDNFFELGGHSLLATQVISKIRGQLEVELPLKTLFESPGVAQLSRAIDEARAGGGGPVVAAIVPADRSRYPQLPLSYAQERLWFIAQLDPDSAGYNIPGAVTIRGALDVDLLERSLRRIVSRHENLRTVFPTVDGRAQQVVLAESGFAVERVDLSGLKSRKAREAKARALCQQDATTPFDLTRGPLMRVKAIRLSPEEHVLLLNMHHIISDGWSEGVLLRELSALMTAAAEGRDADLPALPIQYADYAVWQRERLEGTDELSRQLGYWREKLSGLPESLDLATDYPRPAVQSFAGSSHGFALDATLTSGLRGLAEREGGTLYMVLLAAFKALLYRYTGQEDICVGSPIANRQYAETEGLIGMFVNTLALRDEVRGEEGFTGLLGRVKTTCLEAYAHQDTPFEKVVEAVQPQRNMAITPLFQVMLMLQNTGDDLRSQFAPYPLEMGVSKFDLSAEFTERDGGLSCYFEYSTSLFRAETIARMAGHFEALCRAIVATPEAAVRDLGYLGAEERQRLLVAFNDTAAEYPKDVCIHTFFERQATEHPERVAVVCGESRLSYGEVLSRSRALALWLQSQGVGPDVIVGLCMERSNDLMVAILGTVMAGGAYLPLDPSYPDDRLTYMLEDSAATVVLTQARFASRIAALAERPLRTVALDTAWETVANGASTLAAAGVSLRREVGPRHLAYVIYTSGSTGRPKGVLVEHQALVNRLVWMQRWYPIDARDVVLQKTPYSFDVSVWEFFWPMMMGASVVFAAPEGHKDVGYLERLIAEAGVTTLHFVPSMLYAYLEGARGPCAGVRQIFCSGEALDKKGVDAYPARFPEAVLHNLYGPTEAAIDVTYYDCSKLSHPFVPIGMPISNISILVLDAQNRLQPIGVPGELHIAGDGLARGYLNRPELTAEKFVENPFVPGTRMYRTGDLARWLDDGNVQYLGRIDNQVKIRGFRIETGEIEASLNQHPAIQDCAVIPYGPDAAKQLVAFYRARATEGETLAQVPIEELREFLSRTLPDYMVPAMFVSIAAIPLSSNGKVDRRALSRMDVTIASGRAYVAPRTATERSVVSIWSQVLGVPEDGIGAEDNFFELGGHSLLATQVISKIRGQLEVELPLKTLFESPGVAQLSRAIDEARAGGGGPVVAAIVPADRSRYPQLPLSYAQERLWFIAQLDPDSAGYNIPGAVTIRGALDVDLLERSLRRIVSRHENLRTVFPTVDGRAQQVVLAESGFAVERVDLSGLKSRKAREAKARALCQQDATTPFDLTRGPLMRVKAIRLSPEEHVLLLNMHHIISDGWSEGVLLRELSALMTAAAEGRDADLPALPIQYADYAVWQRERLEGTDELSRQLGYWREKLSGLPESLDLATDYPRPAVQSFAGSSHGFALDATLTSGLRGLAEREGGTLYMVLLAAFKALLYRYTGQEDICVGSPIANRQYAETEGLIGMFVNTLALRDEVRGEEGFTGLLGRVKTTCLEAYAHQDTPFEKVVEAVQPQRNMAITPLFQVMLMLQNTGDDLRSQFAPYPLEMGVSKFDLSAEFTERDGGLSCYFEYSTSLFRAETIARMAGHFEALCRAIVATPEAAVRDLGYLGAEERQRLLVAFNDTAAEYPKDVCIHTLFEVRARTHPERIAATCGTESLTYAELSSRSEALALWLQAQGVGPDVLVGVCMERSLSMVVALLGVLRAGGAYVPLDPAYPEERLAHMIEDSAAPIVLSQRSLEARLSALAPADTRVVALDTAWPQIAGAKPKGKRATLRREVGPSDLAYVIYTSGSTGKPKGVAIEHHSAVTLIQWAEEIYSEDALSGVLASTSICFDLSVYELFLTLASGGRVIVVQNALGVLELPEDAGVTLINTVPSAMEELVRLNAIPRSVRTVNLAGEPLSAALVNKIYAQGGVEKVYDLYGPSEDTTYSTFVLRQRDGLQTIGRPIANTRVYILDAAGRPQPIGVPGELHIAGDGLARGYLNRPELTAEKFVDNPFEAGGRMYRTGDLARWLDDGNLQYLGRIDTQVKIRGFRIETGEIEARLLEHPEIDEAVVIAQGEGAGKRLVAFYRAKGSLADAAVELPQDILAAHLGQRLPEYMVPAAFVALATIPLNPNGKIDRRALSRMDVAFGSRQAYVAPRDDAERALVAIWSDVLALAPETIGVYDSFFELGGHSLSAVRLMARVNREFGQLLPLATLFTAPHVAALAQRLSGDDASASGILVPIQPLGDRPPLFGIPGVGGNVLSLRPLAMALGEAQPFYGLQAVGLDGRETPLSSVEETARANIEAMRAQQPVGPYRLVGHSYGGVIAFEIARQLQAQGERVASLTLLDSRPQPDATEGGGGTDDAEDLREACEALARMHGADVVLDAERLRVSSRGERIADVVEAINARGIDVDVRQFSDFYEVFRANLRSYRAYRPRRLARRLQATLYRAVQAGTGDASQADYGWSRLLRGPLVVHDIDAGHFSMLEAAHVDVVADALAAEVGEDHD